MPSPATERRQRGDAAELAACRHLQQSGLRLLAGNAGFRVGELDLVMQDGATVVFVEVRYRRASRFGDGAASIDRRKCQRIARAASLWLARHPAQAQAPCRFDVVSVGDGADGLHCDWIRAAFSLDDL